MQQTRDSQLITCEVLLENCASVVVFSANYPEFIQLNGSVIEPNMFHNYETEKITRKASDAAEYIKLFGSSARDRHARHI